MLTRIENSLPSRTALSRTLTRRRRPRAAPVTEIYTHDRHNESKYHASSPLRQVPDAGMGAALPPRRSVTRPLERDDCCDRLQGDGGDLSHDRVVVRCRKQVSEQGVVGR